jgi:hypothetical protein
VVAAFLERPLELGVRGAVRLVSFPYACTALVSALVNVCWACFDERLRVPGSSPVSARPRRLIFGAASPSLRCRPWPFAVAAVCARAPARLVKLGITVSMPVSAKTRRTVVPGMTSSA